MECALWYFSHGSLGFVVCSSEEGAVQQAQFMWDDEWAAPVGVQMRDGTYTKVEEWPALKAAKAAAYEAILNEVRSAPRPVTVQVRPPFDDHQGRVASVEDSAVPHWMRAQIASR